jgi:two-component system, chemotaxis family, sensor kinase CheA
MKRMTSHLQAARMDEILGEFIAETLESLETLSGEVVAWEADPTDQSRLDAFFRFFHTVKGSCGFLNLPRFERLAHAAEDVLATIRRGHRGADPETVSAVLAIMDRNAA